MDLFDHFCFPKENTAEPCFPGYDVKHKQQFVSFWPHKYFYVSPTRVHVANGAHVCDLN